MLLITMTSISMVWYCHKQINQTKGIKSIAACIQTLDVTSENMRVKSRRKMAVLSVNIARSIA